MKQKGRETSCGRVSRMHRLDRLLDIHGSWRFRTCLLPLVLGLRDGEGGLLGHVCRIGTSSPRQMWPTLLGPEPRRIVCLRSGGVE